VVGGLLLEDDIGREKGAKGSRDGVDRKTMVSNVFLGGLPPFRDGVEFLRWPGRYADSSWAAAWSQRTVPAIVESYTKLPLCYSVRSYHDNLIPYLQQ